MLSSLKSGRWTGRPRLAGAAAADADSWRVVPWMPEPSCANAWGREAPRAPPQARAIVLLPGELQLGKISKLKYPVFKFGPSVLFACAAYTRACSLECRSRLRSELGLSGVVLTSAQNARHSAAALALSVRLLGGKRQSSIVLQTVHKSLRRL
jgi:hypothetical protein